MKYINSCVTILSIIFILATLCITSCTEDYGPEIDKIKEEVSNLKTSVDKLKEAYEGGKIVTEVTPIKTGLGGWKIKFSDESTINLQNGGDGKDAINGIDGVDGVTPFIKIDNNCNWVVSYDNGKMFTPILDAAGNRISAKGKDGNNGTSVDVRVNSSGNYEIITYRGNKNNPISVLSTPYNSNPANQIASIIEDSERGMITMTMSNGQQYNFGQALNYPTSLIIIDEEIIVDEVEGTAEIEFRVNPSNAKITKEDIIIDQISLTEELRSFANPTPNYEILSMENSLNSAGGEIQGQYKLAIKHKGDRGTYSETCAMIVRTKDAQNNDIEISSKKFYLISQIPFDVEVVASDGGVAEASESQVLYNEEVTLTATPEVGWQFVNWTQGGTVVSTENPYTTTITANSSYTANFERIIYTVTVSSSTGGTATISSATGEYGDNVTLTATPEEGYLFVNWTLNGEVLSTESSYTATITANSNYVATFTKIVYTVSVSSDTKGTAIASSTNVEHGDNVTLTATPNEGYSFVNWTQNGEEVSTENPYTVYNVTANSSYMANFERMICAVSVSSNAGGTVASSTGSVEYGGSVTLTATPNEGYFFQNWKLNGTVVSTSATFTATVTANSNYVATFSDKKGTYTVNLKSQWRKSSSVSNPNSTLYDGVYESNSNYHVHGQAAVMYITISGYTNFKFYIRSNGESNYDYIMVSQLDASINNSTSYSSTSVKAHTRSNSTSGTSISYYTLVSFTNIDGGEHTITVLYRKDSSDNSGTDRGYVLIPKNQ
ncbi:MAG: hypothetical protein IKW05_00845 [Muribaculaceae bacterium]|nr:hypothetical protein [Muribaculaceae bacterium]